MYNHGTYKLSSGFSLTQLPRNTIKHRQVIEAGSMSNDHSCTGVTFNLGESTWNSVVVQASYEFFTTKTETSHITDKNKIQLASGYQYDYPLSESFDSSYGTIFWDTVDDLKSCSSKTYGVLYEGIGTLFHNNNTITVTVNTSDHAIAIDTTEKTILCNNHAYRTEHTKLWVIKGESYKLPVSVIKSEDLDMFLYTNSKVVYVMKHFQSDMRSLYILFHKRTCELKNIQLNYLISLAYIDPEQFAWNTSITESSTHFCYFFI